MPYNLYIDQDQAEFLSKLFITTLGFDQTETQWLSENHVLSFFANNDLYRVFIDQPIQGSVRSHVTSPTETLKAILDLCCQHDLPANIEMSPIIPDKTEMSLVIDILGVVVLYLSNHK
jgi:hypothetical protein